MRYSPESGKYPPQMVERHIFRKEQKFARECLGFDFYDLLIADLKDWSSIKAWVSGTSYDSGDLVNYYGLIIESKVAANTNDPCEDTGGAYWMLAQKFNTACYETLWADYMRDYLSFSIMAASIDHTTYPVSAKGAQEWAQEGGGSGSKSASYQVFVGRKNKLLNDAAEVLENMKGWVLREHADTESECDFSEVLFVQQCYGVCEAPRQSRKFFFRAKPGTAKGGYPVYAGGSKGATAAGYQQVNVIGSATFTIGAKKLLEHIVCEGASGTVEIGTTLGGSEIVDGAIVGGTPASFSVFQYFTSSTIIYLTGTFTAKLYII